MLDNMAGEPVRGQAFVQCVAAGSVLAQMLSQAPNMAPEEMLASYSNVKIAAEEHCRRIRKLTEMEKR